MDMCLFQECLDSNALPLHSPLARFSLFIYIPRGIMGKRRRDGTFWEPNACQSKWFVFGIASLFVRDRICLIMCSPNTLQKLCQCFMDLKLVGIGKDFLLINMFTCKANKRPMMKW